MATQINIGTTVPPFDGQDQGQKLIYVFGTIALTGNYVAGGDLISWLLDALKTGYIPVQVQFFSQSAAAGHSGYQYYWRPGTTLANGKIQVETTGNGAGNPLQELAAGAYPAAITGDTIAFAAVFLRL